jgi:uncharacterized surface protein with fasciclin (FAS1) repeats
MKQSKLKTLYRYTLAAGLTMALGPLAALSLSSIGSKPTLEKSAFANAVSDNLLAAHDSKRNAPLKPAGTSVVELTDKVGTLAFFGSLLRAADLGELLQVKGPYTVFMPMDEAFRDMPGEELSRLVNDPESLRALLKAHIVPGRVWATDLMSERALISLDGARIEALAGADLRVNGATVLATEVVDEGVVHYVDRLL